MSKYLDIIYKERKANMDMAEEIFNKLTSMEEDPYDLSEECVLQLIKTSSSLICSVCGKEMTREIFTLGKTCIVCAPKKAPKPVSKMSVDEQLLLFCKSINQ